jgi:hypothetical protein
MPSWSPLPPRYLETLDALHTVAEHILAAARYHATGKIGLRSIHGGVTTPTFDGRRVEVVGGDLVVYDGVDDVLREPVTTLRSAATLVGVEAGMPDTVYRPTTPLDLDAGLEIDPDAMTAIAEWYELISDALGEFVGMHQDEAPGEAELWPEHFDLALSMSDVNYGGSPGDAVHPEPYLYVGPFSPRSGPFWNESFGASRLGSAVGTVDDAVAFFEAGRAASRSEDGPAGA